MPSLTAITGPVAGKRFEIGGRLVIGREGEIRLPEPQVSRHHAAVQPVPAGIEVTDLDSLNGTWVDGRRVTGSVTVSAGGRLSVGSTTFSVEVPLRGPAPGPEAARAPAAADLTRVSPPQAAPTPAAPPAPAPPAPPAEPAAAPAAHPFAPAGARARPSRSGAATRLWLPAVLSFAVIAATAVALVAYFALR